MIFVQLYRYSTRSAVGVRIPKPDNLDEHIAKYYPGFEVVFGWPVTFFTATDE